ncbi:hypothetical protein Cgig2_027898 [Carnegiea gigantea]|uniref:Uncharacterized protein n=1 Tax=Carnegiea gigantea TaxID=171969 RepID=A0A9Q1KNF9_9CARY|nr:hypothetical protein Cgig2_027898 [Carnegiea gigantea]
MLMAMEWDIDVRMIFKGNDEHNYLYVVSNNGSRRRVLKGVAACEGWTCACDDGVLFDTSVRGTDLVVHGSYKRGGKELLVKGGSYEKMYLMSMVNNRGESANDHCQSRMRLRGEIMDLLDTNEISSPLNDRSNEKLNDYQNIKPRSNLQAQSCYHEMSI